MGFAFFATSATADVTPPWWCFDTPERGQFCGHYKAPTAELASIRAADEAEAKMCIAFDCVQSANNGIGGRGPRITERGLQGHQIKSGY